MNKLTGLFYVAARTELKELVPDVSDATLDYLNKAITAAYAMSQAECDKLQAQIKEMSELCLTVKEVNKIKADAIRQLTTDKPGEWRTNPIWVHGRSEGRCKDTLESIIEFIENFADEVESE